MNFGIKNLRQYLLDYLEICRQIWTKHLNHINIKKTEKEEKLQV